ncbi:MAG: DUF2442 domain-containing protein [Tissierellia bacterium]|jgi:S-adenosylmethionine hydrolase|nr:DUF2442 domain-containing protein [Tissierellia bacterium]HKM02235.1 hypothetical protein [Sedimentibacter sp.]
MKIVEMPQNVREYFATGPRRIKKVTANEDYTLTNDEIRLYDMNGMLYGVFEVLKDKGKFKEVFIDEFGNIAWDIDKDVDSNIHWNNRIDLCSDSVYLESKPVNAG